MGNISIGNNNITDLKLGTNQVSAVYRQEDLIWTKSNKLLDIFSADYAYSVRRLKTSHTNPIMRVRRTTTSPTSTTTVDLFFDSNDTISFSSAVSYVSGTTTLATTLGQFSAGTVDGFGAQSVFVSIWYDQSGNELNMTQSAFTARQPRLVNAGVLEQVDGTVAVRWLSSLLSNMSGTSPNTIVLNKSSYVVTNPISNTQQNVGLIMLRPELTGVRLYIPFNRLGSMYIYYQTASGNGTFATTNTAGVDRLYELLIGDTLTSAYSNGVQLSPSTVTSIFIGGSATTNLGFVNDFSGNNYHNGHIKEAISFNGTSQRQFIENNINLYYNIW